MRRTVLIAAKRAANGIDFENHRSENDDCSDGCRVGEEVDGYSHDCTQHEDDVEPLPDVQEPVCWFMSVYAVVGAACRTVLYFHFLIVLVV